MKLSMVALTDVGLVRTFNEDACRVFEKEQFAIVCDGMGGHNGGAVASQMAVNTLFQYFSFRHADMNRIIEDVPDTIPPLAKHLIALIRLANHRIHMVAQKKQDLKGMGTTLSAVVFEEGLVHVGHVGDSRVYRFRKGRLERLTEDHTWINELIQDNEISQAQARSFEKRNVITRALGIGLTTKIDIRSEPTETGDLYLLCSDGLHGVVSDEEIEKILAQEDGSLELSALSLIARAKENGSRDNISVALARVIETKKSDAFLSPTMMTMPDEEERISIAEKKLLKRRDPDRDGRSTQAPFSLGEYEEARPKRHIAPMLVAAAIVVFLLGFFARGQWGKLGDSDPSSTVLAPPDRGKTAQISPQTPDEAEASSDHSFIALVRYDDIQKFYRDRERLAGTPLDIVSLPNPHQGERGYEIRILDGTNRSIYLLKGVLEARRPSSGEEANGESAGGEATRELPPFFQGDLETLPGQTLANRSKRYGKIFLIGFAERPELAQLDLLINDRKAGKLEKFLRDGIYLRPGTYTVSLKDSSGQLIKEYADIRVSAGNVKALEYR